nr:retrovirus-related Pol polyprotein from transposon TNT 1-94 [Tanacetum cinerariifolium]
MHPGHQISEHNSKWSKDHPLENIIGKLARPVSTRLQLHEQAIFCYNDAFLTFVKPKTYKDALTQSCWIEAMQEELNEFKRLKVWELVPRPDKVMVITLKWIYKVKLDELGCILKNKAWVVARGYRQKEGIDFEESFAPVSISHETSVARSTLQNGVIERRNHMLIEDARTMLIYARASLFLWAEAVATICFTQNRSIIRLRHDRTPYELLHNRLPDISYFYVFGALCYLTNDSENLGKLQPKANIVSPKLAALTGSPSSTTVDQDAPSPSNSQSTPETQPPVIPYDVEEDNHDIEVTHMSNDLYFGNLILGATSNQSSSTNVIHTIMHPDHQISEHNSKWSKDHPLENII